MNIAALTQSLDKAVSSGDIVGAGTLRWRKGNAQAVCAGWRDVEAHLPIEPDTIFRIASMSKPITSLAALMLIDEGRIALSDPISRFAPEFSAMRVLRSLEGDLRDTDQAKRAITFDDLLTHRAGLTYGDFHRGPLREAYREALGGDIDNDLTPDEWIGRLAKLPLIGQPGALMTYGCATDLLGFLISRVEGRPLGAVLKRRIFDPLGMSDTGFLVPMDKRHRRACAYGFDEKGQLSKCVVRSGVFVAERSEVMSYESGGAGLWSTLGDYLKFARVFLGDGSVDGTRLLRPETLKAMMSNQLTDSQRANSRLLGQKPFAVGRGFGFGLSVILETEQKDMMRRGGPGAVSWPGAFGGWWQADPDDQSVLIFLAHNMADLAQMAQGIGIGVWGAIETFQSFATAA